MASAEVRTAYPTATNCVPDQATAARRFAVRETLEVHSTPSGEATTTPPYPTATYCVPDHVTPSRLLAVPDLQVETRISVLTVSISVDAPTF